MNPTLEKLLFDRRPPYEDRGAGEKNARILADAGIRPAFFDMSCLTYRLIYAKAKDYVKKCGADRDAICFHVSVDVFNDIAEACRHMGCAPVLAFDSTFSLRKQVYPEYKGNRGGQKVTAEQEFVLGCKVDILRLMHTVLAPMYYVQTFCVHGYESDDIIASFVLGLKQTAVVGNPAFGKPVVVVTNDGDLYQLAEYDDVYVADVTTGVLCKGEDIERHTGIAPRDVVAAKCVGGCKSDTVGNVPGCGEKTVEEILKKRSDNVTVKKAWHALHSDSCEEILQRNLKLIRLPYAEPPFPPLLLGKKTWPKADFVHEDLGYMFKKHGIGPEVWPKFGDIRLPRAAPSIPMCAYKKAET